MKVLGKWRLTQMEDEVKGFLVRREKTCLTRKKNQQ